MQHRQQHLLARAQCGALLDANMQTLLKALVETELPPSFGPTGLSIRTDPTSGAVVVRAHGKVLRSEQDHVWLKSDDSSLLVGRIQFRLGMPEAAKDPVVCVFIVDNLGNLREGTEPQASHYITEKGLPEAVRYIRRELLYLIHERLDTIVAPRESFAVGSGNRAA